MVDENLGFDQPLKAAQHVATAVATPRRGERAIARESSSRAHQMKERPPSGGLLVWVMQEFERGHFLRKRAQAGEALVAAQVQELPRHTSQFGYYPVT